MVDDDPGQRQGLVVVGAYDAKGAQDVLDPAQQRGGRLGDDQDVGRGNETKDGEAPDAGRAVDQDDIEVLQSVQGGGEPELRTGREVGLAFGKVQGRAQTAEVIPHAARWTAAWALPRWLA